MKKSSSRDTKSATSELANNTQDLESNDDSNANNQVTYRVIQFNNGSEVENQSQILGQTGITHVLPAGSFANGSSNSPSNEDASNSARFTYVSGSGTDAQTIESLGQLQTAQGPYVVMMSHPDVIQASRSIAPRSGNRSSGGDIKTSRDERRRATHNAVERRRRDKINNWIVQLSKLIPDCAVDGMKGGQMSAQSKGGILAKACDYINELRTKNERLVESLHEVERFNTNRDALRDQFEELKTENAMLRQSLSEAGIAVPESHF
ncbi:DgyrCDS636 [Dimorphilus gyrociliatus]|uniref:DgyrCDS636 n=1 Tax=Dimorphilus gyrociliatus TaxID=2664684 RepID=A0A7I8V817_9ANNE|nr:DgyrCDS636 [Dimorphilus gyrociliatus]